MRWEEVEKIAKALGGGWKMARGPPPATAVWVVRRSVLEDAEAVCGGEPQPVVYLAARAEGQWFVLGKVKPADICLSVTFYRPFPSARRAVEALVDYGKRIFDFFAPQFDIALIEAVGLCERLDFAEYCERRKEWRKLAARPQAAARRGEPAADGDGRRPIFHARLDIALSCLLKTLGWDVGRSAGCEVGVEVDFDALRCLAERWLSREELEEWERCLWHGHVRRG